MAEQVFKRKFAGEYESEDYIIKKHYPTETWVIIRKSDKKRAFRSSLKNAKAFVNNIGVTDERNWSL